MKQHNIDPPELGPPILQPGTEWVHNPHPPRFDWKPERLKEGYLSEFHGYLYGDDGYDDAEYEQWECRTTSEPFERYQTMHLRSKYPKP